MKKFLFNVSAALAGTIAASYLSYAFAAYLHGACIGVCP